MWYGAYNMHMYCENPTCKLGVVENPAFEEFSAKSQSKCLRQARRKGWVLADKGQRTFCCSACYQAYRKQKRLEERSDA